MAIKTQTNPREDYSVYYPDEGRYSVPMTLREARMLVNMFIGSYIVNIKTAEVFV